MILSLCVIPSSILKCCPPLVLCKGQLNRDPDSSTSYRGEDVLIETAEPRLRSSMWKALYQALCIIYLSGFCRETEPLRYIYTYGEIYYENYENLFTYLWKLTSNVLCFVQAREHESQWCISVLVQRPENQRSQWCDSQSEAKGFRSLGEVSAGIKSWRPMTKMKSSKVKGLPWWLRQ